MQVPVTSKRFAELRELKEAWKRAYPVAPLLSWERETELMDEVLRLSKRVEEELRIVNGKAHTHTLTHWDEVAGLAIAAEKRLDDRGVTLKNRPDTQLFYATPGPWAKAYDASAQGTALTLRRGSGKGVWYLTSARRLKVWPKQKAVEYLSVSGDAAEDIRRKAMEGIHILPGSMPSPESVLADLTRQIEEADHDA